MRILAFVKQLTRIIKTYWISYQTNMRMVKQDTSFTAMNVSHILVALKMLVALLVVVTSALHIGSFVSCASAFFMMAVVYSMFYTVVADMVFRLYHLAKEKENVD